MDKVPVNMRAAVYRGPDDLRVETVPVPRIGANEILVKVAVCGVCPTDIKKIKFGTVTPPRIFGHETAGTIARVGARVRGFQIGERVALHHHVPCLHCHACRHRAFAQCAQYKQTGITAGFEPAGGGFAEYVRVMPFVFPGILKIPARNTFVEGAMLEPVNTVLKAIYRLALLKGDHVLVVGQGPIGLMFTRLLSVMKMNVTATDLIPERLKLASQFGAKWTTVQDSQRVDAAVICAPSNDAVREALEAVTGGGKILLFAHTKRGAVAEVDFSRICVDEKDLIGSYSADFTLQAEVARWVFSRRLDVRRLITHTFPLEDAERAIDLTSTPTPQSLKVVIASIEETTSSRPPG
jgi:L-iditol 2-dehydrogenase